MAEVEETSAKVPSTAGGVELPYGQSGQGSISLPSDVSVATTELSDGAKEIFLEAKKSCEGFLGMLEALLKTVDGERALLVSQQASLEEQQKALAGLRPHFCFVRVKRLVFSPISTQIRKEC